MTHEASSVPALEGKLYDLKSNYVINLTRDNRVIGKLDLNNSPATFEGDLDGSARAFFDYVVLVWPDLIKEKTGKENNNEVQKKAGSD
jgi:hypothetical protein